ncbi:DNA starvation/stationary phase protection protein [Pelagicoccus sp. SDUM812002]|uniref:Dps family protein n=1 Tax=Pelagicoccus sp. SDUM812002 TaxID=3041266 RepID=UPI00280DDC9D|nr:DNA starvation/stationary phase protection protein [Pelagicoccus sp. SDUM812002]MDQ8187402.1 DNA starvation/stationary phase protection protein [Pelagicoccus sp. SDUM812002]
MKKKTKKQNKGKTDPVVNGLRQVIADSYALLGQLHHCHWNVTGHGFFSLHNAFEEQYVELFAAIDEIAERVRALGSKAPGGLRRLSDMSEIKEIGEDASAEEMVSHLDKSHRLLIENLKAARDTAADGGDDQTEDLMIARIQVHEKVAWMLSSYLAAK